MTTSIGVGSSAILVLEDSQEGGGGDGRKAVGGVVAPRSLATFRLRLRPSDEDDDDERTANTEEEAGGGIGKVEVPEEDEGEAEEDEKEAAGGREGERGDYLKLAESLVRQQS